MPPDDEVTRCDWATGNTLEKNYHDKEWSVPAHDERVLFEMLILESAQAGLSWSTILAKREGYREAFDNFDVQKVSKYSNEKIEALVLNKEIVRHRLKINAAVNNAKCFLEVADEFGSFDAFIWSFVDGKPLVNQWKRASEVPASTELSDRISKELKKRGFKFIGSTICYAYMQAIGMVNDHTVSCFRYDETAVK